LARREHAQCVNRDSKENSKENSKAKTRKKKVDRKK
jgi:hypothetical protein